MFTVEPQYNTTLGPDGVCYTEMFGILNGKIGVKVQPTQELHRAILEAWGSLN